MNHPLAAAAMAMLLASTHCLAANPASLSALAAVDLNRTAIIADIVASFTHDMVQAHPGEVVRHTGMLRSRLTALRADQLLAASLASSYGTLQTILADADRATLRPIAKALGDPDADLTYTPLAPCRLIDTRGFGAPIQGGAFAPNERRSYDPSGNCGVPATGVASLMVSFTTQNLTPVSGGYLAIVAPAAPIAASVDVFNLNSEWSASNTVVATGGAGEFDVFVNTANAHVVIDILGYFRAPSSFPAGDVTAVTAGTGLTGGGASGDVMLDVATSYRLPQGCAATQLPKWNGAAWACSADNDTNTTYTAGAGITLSGTEFSLPASQRLPSPCGSRQMPKWSGTAWTCSPEAFAQGGNAFGTTARLGTTDDEAVEFLGNGTRMLRLQRNADTTVNVIGGSAVNSGSANGSTIAGGGGPSSGNTVDGAFGTIGGGLANVAGEKAFVGGGELNEATGARSAIAGGTLNEASGSAFIGAGSANTASGASSVVGGGNINTASGSSAVVVGGLGNSASGSTASVGGGVSNFAAGSHATIAGGMANMAPGIRATVPGGEGNTAAGDYSFAAGRLAQAGLGGCFVWADSIGIPVSCATANQFVARAVGGITFYTNALHTAGVLLPAGGGAWSSLSDRAAKKDLQLVDARGVLERVAAMPLYTWRYTSENSGALHLGPVAQDFRAAFGLGDSDRNISTVDADGVALAAIQGLSLENRELKADLGNMQAVNGELRERLATQESRIDELAMALAAIRAKLGKASP